VFYDAVFRASERGTPRSDRGGPEIEISREGMRHPGMPFLSHGNRHGVCRESQPRVSKLCTRIGMKRIEKHLSIFFVVSTTFMLLPSTQECLSP